MKQTFEVGALFDIHPTAAYKMKNDALYATAGATPVLSNSSVNNGVAGYCGLEPTEDGNIITFSDTTTGADTMFYQPNPFIGYPHVQGMYPFQPEKWTEHCCIYVISAIRKAAGTRWNYAVKFNRALVKALLIELPVIESSDPNHEYTVDDIDWQHMHDYIIELERERIDELKDANAAELQAYRTVTGFDSHELTDDDKKVLAAGKENASTNGGFDQVGFEEFVIGRLFKLVKAKCKNPHFDKRTDTSPVRTDEFSIPLINAKLGSNGIMFYGRKADWDTQEMCIDVIQNGAVATGTVYAQPEPVAVLWDAYLIQPIEPVDSVEVLLYLARCIERVTKGQFSYDKKATWKRVKECKITLPINQDGELDFDYMERYIRAVEKLVIADVAAHNTQVIETAERLVMGAYS